MDAQSGAVSVTFIEPDGTERPCQAQAGKSLMEVALDNAIDGVVGECGGSATCGTCHVHLDDVVAARLAPPGDREDDVLESALSDRSPTSRLACQVPVTTDLGGLVARVPDLPW